MKAVFDHNYVKRLDGPNVKKGKNKLDLAEQLRQDIRDFASRAARPSGDDLVRFDGNLHRADRGAPEPESARKGDEGERRRTSRPRCSTPMRR